MAEIELHPIAAALGAELQRSDDHSSVFFPTPAVERAAAALRGAPDADEAMAHLCALAAKIRRIAGDGGMAAALSIALVLADKLGSIRGATDRLVAGGVDASTAALLGKSMETRAPAASPTAPPTAQVKAKRGLSK